MENIEFISKSKLVLGHSSEALSQQFIIKFLFYVCDTRLLF